MLFSDQENMITDTPVEMCGCTLIFSQKFSEIITRAGNTMRIKSMVKRKKIYNLQFIKPRLEEFNLLTPFLITTTEFRCDFSGICRFWILVYYYYVKQFPKRLQLFNTSLVFIRCVFELRNNIRGIELNVVPWLYLYYTRAVHSNSRAWFDLKRGQIERDNCLNN